MKATDPQIVATYQKMLLSGKWNRSNIIKYFKGADYIKGGKKMAGTGVRSPYGMRKKEALEIMRNLEKYHKNTGMFDERNSPLHSNMEPATREKLKKTALKINRKNALLNTERGKRPGVVSETVQDLQSRVYKKVDASADYVEFYG